MRKFLGAIIVLSLVCLSVHAEYGGSGEYQSTKRYLQKANTNIVPAADDTYHLGSSSFEWKHLYVDGTAHIDDLQATSASIGTVTIAGDMEMGNTPYSIDGGTSGLAFDVDNDDTNEITFSTTGRIITAEDITINGDDIRCDGDLTITATGSDVLINAGLNVGGTTQPGDNNLRVEGTTTVAGHATFSTVGMGGDLEMGATPYSIDGGTNGLAFDTDNDGTNDITFSDVGRIITAEDITINGDDIRCDGDLTITATGNDVFIDAGLNVGGTTVPGDNNLIVTGNATASEVALSGDLEVNGDELRCDGDLRIVSATSDTFIDSGLTVGSTTEAGDNNLRVEGTAVVVGHCTLSTVEVGGDLEMLTHSIEATSGLGIDPDDDGTDEYTITSTGSTVAAGKMRANLQDYFNVVADGSQTNIATNTAVTVQFATENVDTGSNFASNTFTAPTSGNYLLTACVRLDSIDTAADYYQLVISTTARNYSSSLLDLGQFAADVDYWYFSASAVADMAAGNTAYIFLYQANGTAQSDVDVSSYFTGTLLN